MISVITVLYFFGTLSFIAAFSCLIGIRKVEQLYIFVLLKIFDYAAISLKSKQSENARPEDFDTASDDSNLISRDIHLTDKGLQFNKDFKLDDQNGITALSNPIYFVKSGIEAIIDDDVTKRFTSEQLEVWNFLSRNRRYPYKNFKMMFLTILGIFIRYNILLPFRLIIFFSAITVLIVMSFIMGYIPNIKLRRAINRFTVLVSFRLFIRSFSGVINFHNSQYKAKSDGICVANHTSPIDVIILGCDNVYAMVGQRQGGFMGLMQKAFSCADAHIWFERTETRDRMGVAQRMRDHVEDPDKLPILIFPEGTCINNTSVMMFKKGSFEVGGTVYPVAIKYDPRFADCFWNSDKYSLLHYLFLMMTSWAIKADVWYLPPERQLPGEDAVVFANRVRHKIAQQGGLVELNWDGMLKRSKPKSYLKEVQQKSYSNIIKTD